MSPRWGFRAFVDFMYYTHVAPLGLCWFTLVNSDSLVLGFANA